MPLKPVATQRLYQKVADQIAALIREGQWSIGERLPSERDMAQELGVSRPVVRESMIALELLGMVEVRTGAGIYVTDGQGDPSVRVLEDEDPGPSPFELIAARRVIEGETAAIAALAADGRTLDGITRAINKMEADIDKGIQILPSREDGDRIFHSRIAAASGNSVLVSLVEQLWEGMRRPIFTAICHRMRLPENARHASAEHRLIHERIAARDPDGARRTMHDHLDQVREIMLMNVDSSKGGKSE